MKDDEHEHNATCIVCVHLLDGSSVDWYPVLSHGGRDWLCLDCISKGPKDISVDDLNTRCDQCIDETRRILDPNYYQIPAQFHERVQVAVRNGFIIPKGDDDHERPND